MDKQAVEKIAELEHEQWWHWAKSLTPDLNDILYKLPEGSLEADRLAARLARWSSLFKPYAELTEEQKDQDREWAVRVLDIIEELGYRKLPEGKPPFDRGITIEEIIRNKELPEAAKDLIVPLISRIKGLERGIAGAIELAYLRGKQDSPSPKG